MMGALDPEVVYAGVLRERFKVFLMRAFETIYPTKDFLDNWHLDAIVHALSECRAGHQPRLIINLPPRHLKFFMVSVAWPAYLLGLDPTVKIICVSYSDELTKTLAREFKRVVESAWYRHFFANVRPTKSTENELVTDQGGSRFATSVGGTLTGRGADVILIDDPIKPEDAQSEAARNKVNEWFRSTLLSRLDDKQRSVLAIVMQRMHVNDLTGFVEGFGGFTRLSLPAIATQDQEIALPHGQVYPRPRGEVLQPLREDRVTLERIRGEIGSSNFSAQYQQAPEMPEGSLFKREWIQITDKAPKNNLHCGAQLFLSIDSASSTSAWADYSALCLVYVEDRHFYVLEVDRGRWEYETLKARALRYAERYGDELQFIVKHASTGISLSQYLCAGGYRCQYHTPKTSKEARAYRVLPTFEQQRVHLVSVPGRNAWVEPFLAELLMFPNGKFDDQVDSLVQVVMMRRCHL
jgi:predicted phage terminase large subunit-like protein